MPWTTPPTWSAGVKDQPTLTDYNQLIRDNPNYLLSGRPLLNTPYLGSAITSSTTSWAAVSTTNARMSPTLNSNRVQGYFAFPFKLSFSGSGVAYAWFDVAVDGVRIGDTTLGIIPAPTEGDAGLKLVIVPFAISGLSNLAPNIDLYWKLKVNSGTGYAMNILCATGTDGHSPLQKVLLEV